MIILITYDLHNSDKDYQNLCENIKQCGTTWWHYLESVWLVRTDLTPNECYERIKPSIEEDDNVFIVEITGQNRQGWLPSKAWEWIRNNE